MKAVIITQARMTSTRLPGKVMMEAAHMPLLHYHIHRLQESGYPSIVATTINATDDPIVNWCLKENVSFFRGDEANVLSRYYGAAKESNAEIIVRVTSDCPLIDGKLVAAGIKAYIKQKDQKLFLANTLVRTYPRGFDFAIFSRQMLEEAMERASTDYEKEHVTPYFRQNDEGSFRHQNIANNEDASNIRITLDTAEDYKLIRTLIEKFEAQKLGYLEIIDLFKQFPYLLDFNKNVIQKK